MTWPLVAYFNLGCLPKLLSKANLKRFFFSSWSAEKLSFSVSLFALNTQACIIARKSFFEKHSSIRIWWPSLVKYPKHNISSSWNSPLLFGQTKRGPLCWWRYTQSITCSGAGPGADFLIEEDLLDSARWRRGNFKLRLQSTDQCNI